MCGVPLVRAGVCECKIVIAIVCVPAGASLRNIVPFDSERRPHTHTHALSTTIWHTCVYAEICVGVLGREYIPEGYICFTQNHMQLGYNCLEITFLAHSLSSVAHAQYHI